MQMLLLEIMMCSDEYRPPARGCSVLQGLRKLSQRDRKHLNKSDSEKLQHVAPQKRCYIRRPENFADPRLKVLLHVHSQTFRAYLPFELGLEMSASVACFLRLR